MLGRALSAGKLQVSDTLNGTWQVGSHLEYLLPNDDPNNSDFRRRRNLCVAVASVACREPKSKTRNGSADR